MKPKHKPKRKAAKMERVLCFDPWCKKGFVQGFRCSWCNGWGYLWRKAVKR